MVEAAMDRLGWSLFIILTLTSWLIGCDGGKGGSTASPDTSIVDTRTEGDADDTQIVDGTGHEVAPGDVGIDETADLTADVAPTLPEDFGEPCDDDGDCEGGLCVEAPGGGSLCSLECTESCPSGWVCLQDSGEAGVSYWGTLQASFGGTLALNDKMIMIMIGNLI